MSPTSATSSAPLTESAARSAEAFRYEGYDADPETGRLRLAYRVGRRRFEETLRLPAGRAWDERAWQAARIVFLLAGVSYYKTSAPPVIDLGETTMLRGEIEFLRRFYVDGLGEFAYRNGLDLHGIEIVGGRPAAAERTQPARAPGGATPPVVGAAERPLVPFGGGIDSIVSVESLRGVVADTALFVLSPAGDRFAAIEGAVAASGLPVVRAERSLDAQVLSPAEHGFLTGHVPVTGVLSAVAVLCAVLEGRDAVVMSNERSASAGNLGTERGEVNHQWSKGAAFEDAFRAVLAGAVGSSVEWFSLLRPCSELWVARRFARATGYHLVFRSCNRAFQLDPARRLAGWCGQCDKCCFIDLVLAPFLPAPVLGEVFAGREPLEDPDLLGRFESLLALGPESKPWECVGDADECRSAAVAASQRPDRSGNALLAALVSRLGDRAPDAQAFDRLLVPQGRHHVPARLAEAVFAADAHDDGPTPDPLV